MKKINMRRKNVNISANWLQKRLLAEIRKDLRVVCILSQNGRKIGEDKHTTYGKCKPYIQNFNAISNLLLDLHLISVKNRKLLNDIAQRSLETANIAYINAINVKDESEE